MSALWPRDISYVLDNSRGKVFENIFNTNACYKDKLLEKGTV